MASLTEQIPTTCHTCLGMVQLNMLCPPTPPPPPPPLMYLYA